MVQTDCVWCVCAHRVARVNVRALLDNVVCVALRSAWRPTRVKGLADTCCVCLKRTAAILTVSALRRLPGWCPAVRTPPSSIAPLLPPASFSSYG